MVLYFLRFVVERLVPILLISCFLVLLLLSWCDLFKKNLFERYKSVFLSTDAHLADQIITKHRQDCSPEVSPSVNSFIAFFSRVDWGLMF